MGFTVYKRTESLAGRRKAEPRVTINRSGISISSAAYTMIGHPRYITILTDLDAGKIAFKAGTEEEVETYKCSSHTEKRGPGRSPGSGKIATRGFPDEMGFADGGSHVFPAHTEEIDGVTCLVIDLINVTVRPPNPRMVKED